MKRPPNLDNYDPVELIAMRTGQCQELVKRIGGMGPCRVKATVIMENDWGYQVTCCEYHSQNLLRWDWWSVKEKIS